MAGDYARPDAPSVVEKLLDRRRWGTVRYFLNAMHYFYDFLAASAPDYLQISEVESLRASLKGCIKSVTKEAQKETQSNKLPNRKKLIAGDLIGKYLDRQFAKGLSEKSEFQQISI